MFNGSGINSALINGSASSEPTVKTHSPDQPYILYVHDSLGKRIDKVDSLIDGNWDSKINSPGTLKLKLPLDSKLVQSGKLTYPNRIFIYDSAMTLMSQFVITKTNPKVSAKESIFDMECRGILSLLSNEFAPQFEAIQGNTNFASHVVFLLSAQQNGNPITVGYIHPEFANRNIAIGDSNDKPVLDALMFLWKQVGGVISVDPYGRLRWDTENTNGASRIMSLGIDIESYQREEDADTVVNRIYVKGNIHQDTIIGDHRRARLSVPFVEDIDSQLLYGIRPKYMSFNAESPEELLMLATRTLNSLKDPSFNRSIGAIDLARVQLDPDNPITPHPEYIYPGAKLKVNPPPNIPNDSTFKTMVLTVKRDLKDFLKVEITVGNGSVVDGKGRRVSGSDSEFFDLLTDDSNEFEEYVETLFEQDENLWEAFDFLSSEFDNFPDPPATGTDETLPVSHENTDGISANVARADHTHAGIIMVPFDGAHTAVSDLDIPEGIAFGYLGASAGTLEGLWFFPPDGTVNADWIPMPSYN